MADPVLITPPEPVVTVAEAKEHTRISHDAEDALVEQAIAAATAHLDGWQGILGRALGPQEWEIAFDRFPTDAEIRLPLGPVASVTSVKYTATDGTEGTVSSSDYEVDRQGVEGWIVPHADFSWPETMETINAVRVRWVAGTGCPTPIKWAIYVLTTHFYDNRDGKMPDITGLITGFRRIGV